MLNALWASAQWSGSGNGTESDPYLIYTETQLYQMNNFLNQEGVVFKLMKDIDLSDFISSNFPSEGWIPVGTKETPFKGVFNGNNHSIIGINAKRPSTDYVGFFGYLDGATVSNFTLQGSSMGGANYTGALVGYACNNSSITGCSVNVSVITGSQYVGGLIGGTNTCTIDNCDLTGDVTGSGSYVGGVIGFLGNNSTASNCDATTNVAGEDYTGGIFGQISSSIASTITVKGAAEGKNYVGGISGAADGTCRLSSIRHYGNVSGTSYVSGGIGYLMEQNKSTLNSCHSNGKITNRGNYTGGMVGASQGACIESMESCSHFGDITGNNLVGGIVGAIIGSVEPRPTYHGSSKSSLSTKNWTSYSTVVEGSTVLKEINNCTAIGNITGKEYVGGLIGSDVMSVAYTAPSDYKVSDSGTIGPSNYLRRNESLVYSNTTYYYYYSPIDTKNVVGTTLSNSYYSGIITGTMNVGGIVGNKQGGTVQFCYTNASVYGSNNVGGIAGNIFGNNESEATFKTTIKSNVAINSTISATVSDIGRIYGKQENEYVTIGALGTADGNRALTATKVVKQGVVQEVTDNLQHGNAIGEALLKLKANYVAWGWNFNNDWDILDTECFPYKRFQAAPPVIESELVSQATMISGSSLNGGTVYMFYKDRDAVSTTCTGNKWSFATEPLQSGAPVQLYANVDNLTPSYYTSATVGYPGSGTEADPYRIYTAEDLQGASNRGYYKLMNDIDLTEWIAENSPSEGWVSIGRNSGEVTYINGDNHKVSGLWIDTDQDYTGLFSNFSAGVIKNLTVEVASGRKVKGGDYTGVLIGRNANGQILNCTIKGDVEGTIHVGGVTGYSGNNTINAINYEGNVKATADNATVGGFAGLSENDAITSIRAISTIEATGKSVSAGGIIGRANGGSLSKSNAENALSVTGESGYVGGLIGYSDASISQSSTSGTVQCSGTGSYTGGVVGYALKPITDSYSSADISGTEFTAGVCAYTFSTIDKCYSNGNINGLKYGAGVVGELDGSEAAITNSLAANNVLSLSDESSWGSRVIGGFKNGAAEPNETNFALSTMQVSLNGVAQKKTDDAVEGIAKSQSELQTAAFYENLGWDMSNVWNIAEGTNYPYLITFTGPETVLITSITLNKNEASLKPNDTLQLAAAILPEDATEKTVIWSSTNEDVAKVSNSGLVTAIKGGVAYITASANDGSGISESCKITVVEEVTDSENYFSIDNLSVMPGASVRLPIELINESEIAAFSCKITLPEGITLAEDENGYLADVTDRSPSTATGHSHSLTMNVLEDGTIALASLSTEGKSFAGNDGDLFYITINVSNEIADGDYTIKVSDIVLASSSLQESRSADVSATISVSSYILGDVNDDKSITITDAVAIINYIVGKPVGTFNAKAADVDGNGAISITDAVAVVYMVNNIEVSPSSQNAAVDVVEIKDVEISAGETKVIDITVNADYDITAMQMDLLLSQGLNVKNVSLGNGATESHRMFENSFDDGTRRIALLSLSNEAIKDNNESVLRVEIEADETFDGDGTIAISNIIATTTEVVEMPVLETSAKAIGTSGIGEMSNDASEETERFDLAGRKICNPTIGINIVKFSDGTVRKEIVK